MDRILLRIGIKRMALKGNKFFTFHVKIMKLVSLLALNFFTSHSHPHGNFISYIIFRKMDFVMKNLINNVIKFVLSNVNFHRQSDFLFILTIFEDRSKF